MSIDLDTKEINELLRCIDCRLDIIVDEVNNFKSLRKKAINGEINDDPLIYACDNVIDSHRKEYSFLISLSEKISNNKE